LRTESHHRFDRDTAVSLVDSSELDGRPIHVFDARIDPGWWIVAGPNGGYLNAILLRSMMDAVGDASRAPRTQTTHFTARASEGPCRVVACIERSGRSLSTVTSRLEQGGRLIAFSMAALASARPTETGFQDARMPDVPPPDEVPVIEAEGGPVSEFRRRWQRRSVFGSGPASMASEAVTGGWIRLAPDRPGDALLVSALSDAWTPAIFNKLDPRPGGRGVPTVELTVHFRAPAAVDRMALDDDCLVRFRTTTARDGFLEEDGEIWSADGTLLAQSRQLAVLA
jgi:acyl-CoA thioesterase